MFCARPCGALNVNSIFLSFISTHKSILLPLPHYRLNACFFFFF
jgi:hypothetical protein